MNRGITNIRQVEDQKVEADIEITGSEAEEILRRYGHKPDQSFTTRQEEQPEQSGHTFEEMIKQEESKKKADSDRRNAELNGPKPITFDGSNGYDTQVKYGSDDELGFGFKIEVSSDMKLPK